MEYLLYLKMKHSKHPESWWQKLWYGENQGSTKKIKKILSSKKILIQASPESKSNVVHTVTLKDASFAYEKKKLASLQFHSFYYLIFNVSLK